MPFNYDKNDLYGMYRRLLWGALTTFMGHINDFYGLYQRPLWGLSRLLWAD